MRGNRALGDVRNPENEGLWWQNNGVGTKEFIVRL